MRDGRMGHPIGDASTLEDQRLLPPPFQHLRKALEHLLERRPRSDFALRKQRRQHNFEFKYQRSKHEGASSPLSTQSVNQGIEANQSQKK